MKCPVCDSFNVHVVTTKQAANGPYKVVRRRGCRSCGFRWYTAQKPEVNISRYMRWEGDRIRITLPVELDESVANVNE